MAIVRCLDHGCSRKTKKKDFSPQVRGEGPSLKSYAFDPQGSVAQRLSSTGAVASSSVYDAYGAESSTVTPSDPFGWNGRWGYVQDRETGLSYCQNRYYHPETGRWLTRDPIKDGRNWYGYCENNPLRWVDVSGLPPTPPDPGSTSPMPAEPGPSKPPKPTPPTDPTKPPVITSPPVEVAKDVYIQIEGDITLKPPGVTVKPILIYKPPPHGGAFNGKLTFDDFNLKHYKLELTYTIKI